MSTYSTSPYVAGACPSACVERDLAVSAACADRLVVVSEATPSTTTPQVVRLSSFILDGRSNHEFNIPGDDRPPFVPFGEPVLADAADFGLTPLDDNGPVVGTFEMKVPGTYKAYARVGLVVTNPGAAEVHRTFLLYSVTLNNFAPGGPRSSNKYKRGSTSAALTITVPAGATVENNMEVMDLFSFTADATYPWIGFTVWERESGGGLVKPLDVEATARQCALILEKVA